ncbi:MAG: class I SAM-dependent methyltransferase [Acidimicrobiales bacterium]|jgi:cyclopropane fatty-acyl-phospholipid synthase-like methyltransferase
MRLDSFYYRFAYRFTKPRWDSSEPRPELERLIEGRRPGRVLDLGCGTGTSAVYLAEHGWAVVGVDFVAQAIETAKARAASAGVPVSFVVGDVAQLGEAGVEGPFDLLVDIGCYHAIPDGMRDAYAAGVAGVARSGADFYLAGITDPPASWRLLGAGGISPAEVCRRFSAFALEDEQTSAGMGAMRHFALYHLVRK